MPGLSVTDRTLHFNGPTVGQDPFVRRVGTTWLARMRNS